MPRPVARRPTFAARSNEPELHPPGLAELLAGLLAGTRSTAVFPAGLADGGHWFTPG